MPERLLTPEEVSEYLHVTPRTVRDYLRSGRLPGVRMGKLWRVRESDLTRYIEELKGDHE